MPIDRASKSAIATLSRSLKRQIDSLPTDYLRQFFRIRLENDLKSIDYTSNLRGLRITKFKRVEKTLRLMEAANAGKTKSMDGVLDLAYGRKGALKWELLNPILSDPSLPVSERIIPTKENSRPPVYTPELAALLTSSRSRTTKPLQDRYLHSPPTLPSRADPNSEEAKLLGPFSKRREVNIRKRYFRAESAKVLPPLQVTLEKASPDGVHTTTNMDDVHKAGIRHLNFQGFGIFEEIESFTSPPWTPPCATRRMRKQVAQTKDHEQPCSTSHPESTDDTASRASNTDASSFSTTLPRRFLRRRFQSLLGKIPILTDRKSVV